MTIDEIERLERLAAEDRNWADSRRGHSNGDILEQVAQASERNAAMASQSYMTDKFKKKP
jgi:hypothetical protein